MENSQELSRQELQKTSDVKIYPLKDFDKKEALVFLNGWTVDESENVDNIFIFNSEPIHGQSWQLVVDGNYGGSVRLCQKKRKYIDIKPVISMRRVAIAEFNYRNNSLTFKTKEMNYSITEGGKIHSIESLDHVLKVRIPVSNLYRDKN